MEKVSAPSVAIIIPAWNQRDELIQCLESFSCTDYPNYEVVVVNNGAEDNTSEVVRRDFPWATLIEEGIDLGFCKANNIGLRYCLEKRFDYVVLLNADTKILPHFIPELVSVMQSDHKIGIAGAKNLLMENPAYMWGQYGKVTWGPMLVKTIGRFEPDKNLNEPPKDIDWVICNGCIMSRAALEKVGMFDEDFWQCNEDVDWSYRARRAGFRVIYVDTAAILHKGSSSAKSQRIKVFSYGYFLGRNAIVFAKKYATFFQMIKLITMMTMGIFGRCAYHFMAIIKRMVIVTIHDIMLTIFGQRFFIRGIFDGLRGKLSPDYTFIRQTPATAISNKLKQGKLARFKIWLGV